MPDMSRASSPSPSFFPPLAAPSWASDLVHPLPLAAVAVLALNDHLLKGSGLLPGWVTGKLSDVAGLFFFPLLLAAVARGASRLVARRDIEDRKALAAAAGLLTGAVFTAVKLYPPFNAWIASVWGVMSMDATDLFTLPMIPLSAAFMLRAPRGSIARSSDHPARTDRSAPARRFVELAAVLAAGLASAATSKAPEPPPAVPAQPIAEPAVAVAAPETPCASLTLSVCERSSSGTFVVVEATGIDPGSCELDVAEAVEIVPGDGPVNVEMLPARVKVKQGDSTTFSMSFLRPVELGRITENVTLRLEVRGARSNGDATAQSVDMSFPCTQR